jgi:hypothetical protein
MDEATALLDRQLRQLNRSVLNSGGSVKHTDAEHHVKAQYAKFDRARKAAHRAEVADELADLKRQTDALPRGRAPRAGR